MKQTSPLVRLLGALFFTLFSFPTWAITPVCESLSTSAHLGGDLPFPLGNRIQTDQMNKLGYFFFADGSGTISYFEISPLSERVLVEIDLGPQNITQSLAKIRGAQIIGRFAQRGQEELFMIDLERLQFRTEGKCSSLIFESW